MQETCKIENCMDKPKEDSDGYCPSHAPKPWWGLAPDLVDDGKLDMKMSKANEMRDRYVEVFN